VPFALNFSQDINTIIIPQSPGHFVIVHTEVVLLDAPQTGEPSWVDDFEDAGLSVAPRDKPGVLLVLVVEQLLEEVPQQASVGPGFDDISLLGSRGGVGRLLVA